MLSFSSCLKVDLGFAKFSYDAKEIIECNDLHLLEPPVDTEVEYKVLVRNFVSIPLPDVLLNISVKKYTCDGETFAIFSEDIATDEDGFAGGIFPMNFKWDNDAGEWIVGVSRLDFNYASHVERFGSGTDYLYTIITIADLED